MFPIYYAIIDLCVLQVRQLSKNAGLFILILSREKRFFHLLCCLMPWRHYTVHYNNSELVL